MFIYAYSTCSNFTRRRISITSTVSENTLVDIVAAFTSWKTLKFSLKKFDILLQIKKVVPVVMKGAMTKEEWEKREKNKNVISLPDNDSKRLHYDENKRKEKAEYAWVLSGSPPPPHIRAAYKTFKKPQGF